MSGGLWFVLILPSSEYERSLRATSRAGSQTNTLRKDNEEKPKETESCDDDRDQEKTEEEKTLEQEVEEVFSFMEVTDAFWAPDSNQNYYQVTFPCLSSEKCDILLSALMSRGIGHRYNSSIGVVPCSILYTFQEPEEKVQSEEKFTEETKEINDSTLPKSKTDTKKSYKGLRSLQKKFLKSITARLTVAQVVEEVRSTAQLTFDFVMFTIVASFLAALGLVENSSVVLVASMLISPLMGPIMAGTFGIVIRDWPLSRLGVTSETIALTLCLVIGFLFGLICGYYSDSWGQGPWPTIEMYSRGMLRSLWVGMLIALPSGAGVALSILGGNAASLVGVALSASLLPPLVNAGLLWALSAIKFWKAMDEESTVIRRATTVVLGKPSLVPAEDYVPVFSDSMDVECALLGVVSLALTLVNIICIVVMAILVLKVKEVAPLTSKTSRFWKQDIKIARDYNRTQQPTTSEPEKMGNQMLKEWASLTGLDPDEVMKSDPQNRLTQLQTLKDIVQDVEADDVYLTVVRSVQHARPLSQRLSLLAAAEEQRWLENGGVDMMHPAHVVTFGREPPPLYDPDYPQVEIRRKRSAPTPHQRVRSTALRRERPLSYWPPTRRLGSGVTETAC